MLKWQQFVINWNNWYLLTQGLCDENNLGFSIKDFQNYFSEKKIYIIVLKYEPQILSKCLKYQRYASFWPCIMIFFFVSVKNI